MATKTTKKENFGKIIEILKEHERDDLVAVMEHEIELIEKKKASGKMTKTQEDNIGIKELILKVLGESEKPVTITELLNQSKELAEMTGNSNQKVSALMTQLKNAELVERIQDGKKATFKIKED